MRDNLRRYDDNLTPEEKIDTNDIPGCKIGSAEKCLPVGVENMKNAYCYAIIIALFSITLTGCEPVSVSTLSDSKASIENPDESTDLIVKIDSLAAQVDNLRQELEIKNQEIENQKLANEELQSTLKQCTAENEELTQQVTSLFENIQAIQETAASFQDQLNQLATSASTILGKTEPEPGKAEKPTPEKVDSPAEADDTQTSNAKSKERPED